MSNVTTTDIALMREAIALAAEADAPFGAVIVKDGRVLARGRNSVKRLKDPTAHGEMVAIRHCLAEHGPEILRGATIYTSGEPCPMCMGAIAYCRIARVVYGASIGELSKVLGQIKVPSTEIAAKTTFHRDRSHRRRPGRGRAQAVRHMVAIVPPCVPCSRAVRRHFTPARTSWSMHLRLDAWSQLPEDAEPLCHHR